MLAALTGCVDAEGSHETSVSTWTKPSAVASDTVRADSDALLASHSPQLYSPWLDCSTISPANLALAALWLKDCVQNHQPCTDLQIVGTLPTRIINVSNPQEPRLEEGLHRSDAYVSLSYMWGNLHRYVTTKANLRAHKHALPLSQLPLTFKDAIHVTHMLGFQWLWIDALCIIQDSEEDRAREMGAMDKIFRCSALTLFAAASQSVAEGLAVPRDPRWNKPCLLTLRTTLDGETVEGSSYISVDSRRPSEPLRTRGWVLQEEVLATRGLIFSSRELIWRCLCCWARESRPSCKGTVATLQELGSDQWGRWRDYSQGQDGFDLLRMWIMKADPVPDRTPWQRDIHFDHWYQMVTDFSTRKLTYPLDVLPALSGLASAMVEMHHCTYMAGLWGEDLHVGLAWYVVQEDHHHRRNSSANDSWESEQSVWVPDWPSWSWISQHGRKVSFRGWENNHTIVKHESLALTTIPKDCHDFGPNPFAHVTTRSINLTGRIKTAILLDGRDYWHHEPVHNRTNMTGARFVRGLKDPKSDEIIGHIALDEDPGRAIQTPLLLHCLLCTVREKYGNWQLTCLGLLPTDQSMEEFIRIGLISIHDSEWFGKLYFLDTERKDTRVRTVSIV